MQKISIDTGVQEFEINGGTAQGGGVLRFNPSDPNVYNRFFAMRGTLEALDEELNQEAKKLESAEMEQTEKAAAMLALLARYDGKIKAALAEIFGQENDFDKILAGVSLAAVAGNGQRVVQNLMEALAPILTEGAQLGADTKADAALEKAQANRAQRRAAAKK